MKNIFYIFTLLLVSFSVFSQSEEMNYLKNNFSEIKLSDSEDFSFLDKTFYENQIYLFGENHGSAQPHEFDFLFFKHLYQKENVRIYIAEIDQIKAKMLNNFLEDGNEIWLTKVFKSWKNEGAQWANKSNWEKYKKLYVFYKSLPKKDKFKIVGIDVVQDYSLVNEYFKILNNNKVSKIENINKFIQISDTIQYKNRKILGALAREITIEMNKNKAYSKEFKENYEDLDLFIKNAGYIGNKMSRDSIMFKTFEDIIVSNNIKDKKMYGFLGFFHTLQTKYEINPFAACLKNNLPQVKVVSMQMLAINSTVLLPYNEQLKKMMPATYVEELRKKNPDFPITDKYIPYTLSNDDNMMKVDGIEDLKELTKENSISIFKLNASNTPFNKHKKLAEVTGFQVLKMSHEKDATTTAFQYAILFRNSPAALPLDK